MQLRRHRLWPKIHLRQLHRLRPYLKLQPPNRQHRFPKTRRKIRRARLRRPKIHLIIRPPSHQLRLTKTERVIKRRRLHPPSIPLMFQPPRLQHRRPKLRPAIRLTPPHRRQPPNQNIVMVLTMVREATGLGRYK